MLEGFYTTLSGMLVQQRTLSVLGNNIVNSNTPGYKGERVVSNTFHNEVMVRIENGQKINIGTGDQIRLVDEVEENYSESSLESTERPFDMAIVGQGYFTIANGENSYMTRNGNFDIDAEGYLIFEGIGRVQGTLGDIQVGGSDFTVTEEGGVYGADGTPIDNLLITAQPEDTPLEKAPNGMYIVPEGAQPVETGDAMVIQGALEVPNYDVNREYTLIMEAQRAFQACSSALKMFDAISQKAATQIGNVN